VSSTDSSTPASTVVPVTYEPEVVARTVFALEMAGRHVYCASATCVSALTSRGYRLSDPNQLAILVKELAKGGPRPNHDPSDHF
jgi:hypothetical protein